MQKITLRVYIKSTQVHAVWYIVYILPAILLNTVCIVTMHVQYSSTLNLQMECNHVENYLWQQNYLHGYYLQLWWTQNTTAPGTIGTTISMEVFCLHEQWMKSLLIVKLMRHHPHKFHALHFSKTRNLSTYLSSIYYAW